MEKTAEKLKVNESLLKTVLCSATFWGLLAHGMVLFNKYSFHDVMYRGWITPKNITS